MTRNSIGKALCLEKSPAIKRRQQKTSGYTGKTVEAQRYRFGVHEPYYKQWLELSEWMSYLRRKKQWNEKKS